METPIFQTSTSKQTGLRPSTATPKVLFTQMTDKADT